MKFTTEILSRGASLAPMAGATDEVMRRICAQHGAVYTVSEMVSAKALTFGDRKSVQLMQHGGGSAPFGIQLFGAEPQTMYDAVRLVQEMPSLEYDFIDINMGCPAPKITGSGAGSALLKDVKLASQIAQAAVRAAEVPVTVKMRLGWADTHTAAELAARCEQAGVSLVTVHARTREEMYHPGIHIDALAAVKRAVQIPVVANGDVTTADGACALLRQTGCDGVAVGRGAMGNPWLFAQIAAALAGQPIPQAPALRERMAQMRKQIYDMCELKGERTAMQQARGVSGWYMHGLRGAAQLRRACCALARFTDVDELIEQVFALQRKEEE